MHCNKCGTYMDTGYICPKCDCKLDVSASGSNALVMCGSAKEIPEPPNKEKIIAMLNKTHAPGIQNWTTAERQEMSIALQTLAFLWFRDEKLL